MSNDYNFNFKCQWDDSIKFVNEVKKQKKKLYIVFSKFVKAYGTNPAATEKHLELIIKNDLFQDEAITTKKKGVKAK